MSRLWFGGVILAAAAMGAGAAQAQTFTAIGVDIRNTAAQVHIIPENRSDIAVDIGPTGRLPPITANVVNNRVVIDGGLGNRIHGCSNLVVFSNRHETVNIWGIGNVVVQSLPMITVHVPRQLDVNANGAVFGDVGASDGGHVAFGGCGRLAMGPVSAALDLKQTGSGDVDVATVQGALHASLNGSGDLRVIGASGGANLELVGSGDVTLGAISGPLVARLDGSGDVTVPDGASNGDLDLRGSGDVRVGAINGPVRAHVDGSGDLVVASVHGGAADLSLQGSGDLNVNGGVAEHLGARLDGSGDLRFKGQAQTVDADLGGSGDISIAQAGPNRNVRDHGSGDVRFGN